MTNADGIDLVLRRLSSMGCEPQPTGDDGWQASCPVHGGPYPALLARRDGDGSVSVKCRYVNRKGESCPEAEIWKSLGLQPQQLLVCQRCAKESRAARVGLSFEKHGPTMGPKLRSRRTALLWTFLPSKQPPSQTRRSVSRGPMPPPTAGLAASLCRTRECSEGLPARSASCAGSMIASTPRFRLPVIVKCTNWGRGRSRVGW